MRENIDKIDEYLVIRCIIATHQVFLLQLAIASVALATTLCQIVLKANTSIFSLIKNLHYMVNQFILIVYACKDSTENPYLLTNLFITLHPLIKANMYACIIAMHCMSACSQTML